MDTNSISEQKKAIRSRIHLLKKERSLPWMRETSEEILSKVEKLPQFTSGNTILLYHALPDEVQTAAFLEKWYPAKRILIPLVVGPELVLKVFSPDKIIRGYKGIPEPCADAMTVAPQEVDLAIVPGVAYDTSCRRLGRGKGFYDRLIPHLRCNIIGIGFDFQIVHEIPMESFDRPLDGLITEKRTIIL